MKKFSIFNRSQVSVHSTAHRLQILITSDRPTRPEGSSFASSLKLDSHVYGRIRHELMFISPIKLATIGDILCNTCPVNIKYLRHLIQREFLTQMRRKQFITNHIVNIYKYQRLSSVLRFCIKKTSAFSHIYISILYYTILLYYLYDVIS